GGVNSLRAMGAEGDDPALQRLVDQWRAANPNIVALWGEMQEAFGRGGPVGEHMEIVADGDTRWLQLPSGRAIGYHRLKTEWVTTQYGTRKRQHSFADPKKPGLRVRT